MSSPEAPAASPSGEPETPPTDDAASADAGDAAPAEEAASADATAAEPTQEPEPVDPVRQGLIDALRSKLGESLRASEDVGGDLWVRVDVSEWRRAAEVAKAELGMDYFCFLSGLDWLQNPGLAGRDIWDPNPSEPSEAPGDGGLQTGIAGGDTRFQVFARLYSTRSHVGITLKADLDETAPTAPSLVPVYRGADWHEREAWEMYGFDFDGHPGLRHLYLPGEFEGHPLRKDFPMLAREVKPWPGLVDKEQIPGESEPVEEEAAT